MTEHGNEPWSPLSADEWHTLPTNDHSTIFSRDEVRRALEILLVPSDEIPTVLAEVYGGEPDGSTFFYGDLLSALSRVSPSAAERVQSLLTETPAEADARMAAFRETYSVDRNEP
jgi:hypothetical protein